MSTAAVEPFYEATDSQYARRANVFEPPNGQVIAAWNTGPQVHVPEDLIKDSRVSDTAFALWVVQTGRAGRARFSWASIDTVRQDLGLKHRSSASDASTQLQDTGWMQVKDRGSSCNLYVPLRRTKQGDGRRYAQVPVWVARAVADGVLSPPQLRALCRWLLDCDRAGHTAITLTQHATRWGISADKAKRDRSALNRAGLLDVHSSPSRATLTARPDITVPNPRPHGGRIPTTMGAESRPQMGAESRRLNTSFLKYPPLTPQDPSAGPEPSAVAKAPREEGISHGTAQQAENGNTPSSPHEASRVDVGDVVADDIEQAAASVLDALPAGIIREEARAKLRRWKPRLAAALAAGRTTKQLTQVAGEPWAGVRSPVAVLCTRLREATLTAPPEAHPDSQAVHYERWTEALGYCEHDAEIRPRRDGLPSCPMCRRTAVKTAVPGGIAPWDHDIIGVAT